MPPSRLRREYFVPGLALVIIFGFYGTVAAVMLVGTGKADNAHDVIVMLFGSVTTMAGMVVSFYFGSSAPPTQPAPPDGP